MNGNIIKRIIQTIIIIWLPFIILTTFIIVNDNEKKIHEISTNSFFCILFAFIICLVFYIFRIDSILKKNNLSNYEEKEISVLSKLFPKIPFLISLFFFIFEIMYKDMYIYRTITVSYFMIFFLIFNIYIIFPIDYKLKLNENFAEYFCMSFISGWAFMIVYPIHIFRTSHTLKSRIAVIITLIFILSGTVLMTKRTNEIKRIENKTNIRNDVR